MKKWSKMNWKWIENEDEEVKSAGELGLFWKKMKKRKGKIKRFDLIMIWIRSQELQFKLELKRSKFSMKLKNEINLNFFVN